MLPIDSFVALTLAVKAFIGYLLACPLTAFTLASLGEHFVVEAFINIRKQTDLKMMTKPVKFIVGAALLE